MRALTLLALISLTLPACSDDSGGGGGADGGGGDEAPAGEGEGEEGPADGGGEGEGEPPVDGGEGEGEGDADAGGEGEGEGEGDDGPEDLPPLEPGADPLVVDGLWRAGIDVAPADGYVLPLQLEIASDKASRKLTTVRIRALDLTETQRSNVLVELNDVAVAEDGGFRLVLENVLLPGAYTITGSDVTIDSTFVGTINEAGDRMCGAVQGRVVELDMDLAGSTFGAVPVGTEGLQPCSCDGCGGQEIPLLAADDCPVLEPGLVQDFPTNNDAWEFSLYVPDDYSADNEYPLIFLWHGLPSDRLDIIEITEMPGVVDEHDFILVVPESKKEGTYWPFASARDTPSLALFDDIRTCVSDQYSVDADRIHSTGFSGGGLWTGVLVTKRSDILASVATNAGGMLVPYPEDLPAFPALIAWGGPEDVAFGQDFDLLSRTLQAQYLEDGRFVVTCNHGQAHEWPKPALTDAVVRFLLAHPKGVDPLPWADGLPDDFADFCSIAVSE